MMRFHHNTVYSYVLRLFVHLVVLLQLCFGNDNAKRLYDDLLRNSGYNKLIRPVENNTETLYVKLGIRLSQLIDIVSRQDYFIILHYTSLLYGCCH